MNRRKIVDAAFWVFLAVYTLASIGLLLLGLGAVLASVSPRWHTVLADLGQSGGALAPFFHAIDLGTYAFISSDALQVTLDYLLSALNLGFGLFLVWRRPDNIVARLLAVAMIGTAVAFNFQSHTVVGFTDLTYKAHFMIHAISGAAYLTALLRFPDGKLATPIARGLLAVVYTLMGVELLSILLTGFSVVQIVFGAGLGVFSAFHLTLPPPLDTDIPRILSNLASTPSLLSLHAHFVVQAELIFFVMFFGLLVPVAGFVSQAYRYRTLDSARDRQQVRFLLWALGLCFIAGVVFLFLTFGLDTSHWMGSPGEEPDRLERIVFAIFPPIFALIPITLLVGILRLHLFDIDLIINRSLVSVPLTAILAGIFAASISLTQAIFAAFTEEASAPAAAVTTLIVVAAFDPVKNWLQKEVDHRFKEVADPRRELDSFAQQVEQGIWVLDEQESTRRLLQVAVDALDAQGGAVYLGAEAQGKPAHVMGQWNGDAKLRVPFKDAGKQFGVLALGERRSGTDYSDRDCRLLENAVEPVARALALSGHRHGGQP